MSSTFWAPTATVAPPPEEGARATSVGGKYSEYTPWGFNGVYYYVRLGYGWGGRRLRRPRGERAGPGAFTTEGVHGPVVSPGFTRKPFGC